MHVGLIVFHMRQINFDSGLCGFSSMMVNCGRILIWPQMQAKSRIIALVCFVEEDCQILKQERW